MKRQFYFDEVERDLLRNALALWKYRLSAVNEPAGHGHHYAKHFTLGRIEAMERRLAELPQTASAPAAVVPIKAAKS